MTGLSQREQQAEGEKHEMAGHAARVWPAERQVVVTEVGALAEPERPSQGARIAEDEAKLAGDFAARTASPMVASPSAAADDRKRAQADIASCEAKLAGFERRQAEMTSWRERVQLEAESLDLARVEHAARAQELGALDRGPSRGPRH